MPAHKVKIILNPNADLGRAWRSASDFRPIVDEFGGADWSGTVYPTHAIELARQAGEEGYELIISAGGDGTAHEIINGLMQVSPDRRPRLGVLPMGSGNDFSHAIGVDPKPTVALRQILNGSPKQIDIGRLEDQRGRVEYWDNTVGIGFDATVTIRSRNFSYLRGFVIYFLAVLQTIILNHDAPQMQITTDEEEWLEDTLLLVLCNGAREGGGFYVQPAARNDDGIFHYTAIRKVSRPMMLRLVPEVMNGTHGRFPQVRMGKFQRMEINSDRSLIIHIDGEVFAGFGVDVRQLSLEILPNALQVQV